jgi:hypothetical protein
VTLLLLDARNELEQVHVAFVRCRAVECLRPEEAVTGLFEDRAPAANVEPEAAQFLWDVRGEYAGRPGRLLELGPKRRVELAEPKALLGGDGDLAHEGARSRRQLFYLGREGEIDHAAMPPSTRSATPVT